jgi:hypothetical protein
VPWMASGSRQTRDSVSGWPRSIDNRVFEESLSRSRFHPRPRRVLGPEHDLLSIARALVGALPAASVRSLLVRSVAPPDVLTPEALVVLEQTLARGGVYSLMARGGAWRVKSLREGTGRDAGQGVIEGRLWERHRAPELRYGPFSFALCRWLLRAPLGEPETPGLGPEPVRYWGDQFLGYLASDLLAQVGMLEAVTRIADRVPLAALAFSDVLGDGVEDLLPRIDSLLTADGAILLEALAPGIAQNFVRAERRIWAMGDPERIVIAGERTKAILEQFVAAAEQRGRLDLLTPLVAAGMMLFPTGVSASVLVTARTSRVAAVGSLALRQRAWQAGGAIILVLSRLADIHDGLRHVGFIDDGYEAAQAVLASWESFGTCGFSRVREVASELGRLAQPSPSTLEPQ